MRTVDVRTLKAQASELLHAVERGETILITRRGRPIARLEGAAAEPEQGMRLRGIFAILAPALEGTDLVGEIREIRRESTARLLREWEPQAPAG